MRGFTLIELLVYIGLYAILMSGTLPAIAGIQDAVARSDTQAQLLEEGLPLLETLERYAAEGDDMTMFTISNGTLMQRRGNTYVAISSTNVAASDLSVLVSKPSVTDPAYTDISFSLAARTNTGMLHSHAFSARAYENAP